eukprot:CAMPEP_0170132938 /NCGR_PEP_ID=MMETSP0033_2-20121228/969_1 /TAXON_ID=195969 /ORGANISM="Dolichomastix tenuilepis, Strain CCMP3274" /LENGTH=233 /DNA_ID=CAMNT_0010368387 /DNA_START=35 /DNA_END=736 /DNA_ORIENTATION=+
MTTAHRPTWAPAKGHEDQGGTRMFGASHQRKARDQASQMTLKFREEGQASAREVSRRDLKAELDAKEKEHFGKREAGREGEVKLIEQPAFVPRAIDADDSDDGGGGDSDDDDSDDEDDTAALLAELERIKKERAEEAARKEAEAADEEASAAAEEMRSGNPLLFAAAGTGGAAAAAAAGGAGAGGASFALKRRWDDDVVFKNQARSEPKAQKRFINDTVRSEFHRRFMNKYVR